MNNSKSLLGTLFLGIFFVMAAQSLEGTYASNRHSSSETRPTHQNSENMKPGASKVGCSATNPYGC
jgi:hypothetical protein